MTSEIGNQPWSDRVRKILRYIELYGVRRTLSKVSAQYHMASEEGFSDARWENTHCRNSGSPSKTIGIMGCGAFAFSNIAYYLAKEDRHFLRGAMDISPARARSLVAKYDGAYATTDPMEIIQDPEIDTVFIASNHATHATYAIEALNAGKHVHIEKPHVVTDAQLKELEAAMAAHPDQKVFLGFNRPRSDHFLRLKQELMKESGPLMINWFVVGHAIDDDHWYFNDADGGRILGNLCHWSDLTLEMIAPESRFPCKIIPISPPGAKSDFITAVEFADGTLAAITFSAKGETFEGVRETLNVHKGDLLAEIKDFKSLSVIRGASRSKQTSWHRDHGHGANITNTLRSIRGQVAERKSDRDHVLTTAKFFLAIRDAHRDQTPIELSI